MKIRSLIVAGAAFGIALLLGQAARRGDLTPPSPLVAPESPATSRLPSLASLAGPVVPAVPAARESPSPRRAGDEWQGQLVDQSVTPPCQSSSRCGLARACVAGSCVGCASDDQCAAGEACVLEHCLKREQIGCRSRRDCGGDSLCVLSGYSADPRGNGQLAARCLAPRGGQAEAERPRRQVEPAPPTPVRPDELLRSLATPG